MKERPILFSAPMVRSILSGTKTQTRRIVKPQPRTDVRSGAIGHWSIAPDVREFTCPYGEPGDQLWVRETFAHVYRSNAIPEARRGDDVAYKADGYFVDESVYGIWKPSIHMPRWASRITLEVTDVRVERLRDISNADALAEGVQVHPDHHNKPRDSIYSAVSAYRDLWESIYGEGSWDANLWVWVVEFRRV